ncbi:hypothetical protein EG329_013255 [Mollisiaceae sp. DMI_Dod_QoI]|nr:hypothetical protein EG329_013255 [Helotiales sp. DMI_Dod_QoI]
MASSIPLTFLRPMALPRASTISHFLGMARLSTTAASTSASKVPSPATETGAIERKVYTYRITQTASKNYPIYTMAKRGGNMKLTKLRKIEGDVNALRKDLQVALGMDERDVVINQLTRHIIVKGHKTKEIEAFLTERGL